MCVMESDVAAAIGEGTKRGTRIQSGARRQLRLLSWRGREARLEWCEGSADSLLFECAAMDRASGSGDGGRNEVRAAGREERSEAASAQESERRPEGRADGDGRSGRLREWVAGERAR